MVVALAGNASGINEVFKNRDMKNHCSNIAQSSLEVGSLITQSSPIFKNLHLSYCYAVVFFLLFFVRGLYFSKNNWFDYQAVTINFENTCKYIWSIGSIWRIFAS